MATFTPVEMINVAGQTRTASSWSEYNQYLWQGWWATSGPPPGPPTVESRLKDVEDQLVAMGSKVPIAKLTQAEYDSIARIDPGTLYIITDG